MVPSAYLCMSALNVCHVCRRVVSIYSLHCRHICDCMELQEQETTMLGPKHPSKLCTQVHMQMSELGFEHVWCRKEQPEDLTATDTSSPD